MTDDDLKRFQEFCNKEVDDFSAKVVELFPLADERMIWLRLQPKFQEVFMVMAHRLGIEKSRKIFEYYCETEQRVLDFTNKINLEKK